LSYALPQSGGTKTFTVDVTTSCVGVGCNDTAGQVKIRLSHLKYHDSQGNITTSVVSPASFSGNSHYVVAAYPVFTNAALPTTVLSTGTQTIFKTTASSVGGQVVWRKLQFTVALGGSAAVTTSSYKLFEDGSDITSLASVSGSNTAATFDFSSDRVISGTRTYELRVDVTTAGTGDSISTQIANPQGTTVSSDDEATQAAKSASFVWSDSSAAAHSDLTDDWFTDGLLKTIAASESLSK